MSRHLMRVVRHLLAFLLLCSACTAMGDSVVVYGAEDYPVICFLKDGKPAGVFPRILEAVSKYSGDTYKMELLPWKRAQQEAQEGKGGIAHFSWTEERAQNYDFSDPVYGDDIQLVVVRGNEFPFAKPLDLVGKRVGAKLGASFGQTVDALIESAAIKVEPDNGTTGRLHKLLANRIDVAIVEGAESNIDKIVASDSELIRNRSRLVFLPVPLVHDPLHLAFAKSMHKKDVLERFNEALKKFKKAEIAKEMSSVPLHERPR